MSALWRWLAPGLRLKRWLLLFSVGIFGLVAGLVMTIDWRLLLAAGGKLQYWVYLGTGRFFPLPVQGVAITLVGLAVVVFALDRILRWLMEVLLPAGPGAPAVGSRSSIARRALEQRALERGPRIVAIGGGTGLPVLLRGLKEYTANLTAIVTVADDGGSSGQLRREFGILPPGDIRNCLVALADTESLMDKLFLHRFDAGNTLAGHNFGNLFILAMTEITGDFEEAIRQSSQVLAIRGRVLPSTLQTVVMEADLADGRVLQGESVIGHSGGPIERVRLVPADVQPVEDAITAIREADLIVLGPGSLYTSIIPNLLVPGVAHAIRQSRALKVYVCNVMTEAGETPGYSAADHVKAMLAHGGQGIMEYALVNNEPIPPEAAARYKEEGAEPVPVNPGQIKALGVEPVSESLIYRADVVRHQPHRLAAAVMRLLLQNRPMRGGWPWDLYLWSERLRAFEEAAAREDDRFVAAGAAAEAAAKKREG
ncbi:MAG: gluconeogenesis factor YvcK family protein [Symbiobacteriia bacterium]